MTSAGRMVSSLFRSDKSGNPAYILVEKVRSNPRARVTRLADGTPAELFLRLPTLIAAGLRGSDAAKGDRWRPTDVFTTPGSSFGPDPAASRADTRASPHRI